MRFPPRLHIRSTETNVWANGDHRTRVVETRARFLREDGPRRIYEETDNDGVSIVYYGDGIGNLEITDPQTKQLEALDPPQVLVPPSAIVGTRWATGHRLGARVSSTMRECEILPPERCAGSGVTAHCTSHLATGNVVEMRFHRCDGVGFSGEDDVVRGADGHEKMRTRVDDVEDVGEDAR